MGKKGPKVKKKGKKKHKPGKSTKKYQFYKAAGNELSRLKRTCAKCGPGIFMAEHKDRYSCGKCGFMEAKKK